MLYSCPPIRTTELVAEGATAAAAGAVALRVPTLLRAALRPSGLKLPPVGGVKEKLSFLFVNLFLEPI